MTTGRKEGNAVSNDKVKKLRDEGLIKDPLPPPWDDQSLEAAMAGMSDQEIKDLSKLAKKFRGTVGTAIECFIPL